MPRHLTSADGARIAYEVAGTGQPLVLVHGAGSARWSFDQLRPHLEDDFTVMAIDRRGRGDSTDGDEYALEREAEDVGAMLEEAGQGALLLGHSYGGLVSLMAAARVPQPPRMVLYEPPSGGVLADPARIDRWQAMIEQGDAGRFVEEFLRTVGGYSPEQIEAARGTEVWQRRIEIAPTVPRELRAEQALRIDRAALASVTIPLRLLVGSDSPAWAIHSTEVYADALPNVSVRRLEGHGHAATVTGPDLLAREVKRFLLV